jgi:[acyl-carrier-protein] S-malonyltransferase
MAVELQVSGAFHSPLMAPAVGPLSAALGEVELREAGIPVVANVDARPVTEPDAIRARLIDQVTGAVRWTECVWMLRELGADRVVELGPGSVLTGLLKRIDRSLRGHVAGTAAEVEEVLAA